MTMMLAFGQVDADLNDRGRNENFELSRPKTPPSFHLFFRCQPAVQQADLISEGLAQIRVALLGRGEVGRFRGFDQRTDPIDLCASAQLHADAIDQPLEQFKWHHFGNDRLSPGRFFLEL